MLSTSKNDILLHSKSKTYKHVKMSYTKKEVLR